MYKEFMGQTNIELILFWIITIAFDGLVYSIMIKLVSILYSVGWKSRTDRVICKNIEFH